MTRTNQQTNAFTNEFRHHEQKSTPNKTFIFQNENKKFAWNPGLDLSKATNSIKEAKKVIPEIHKAISCCNCKEIFFFCDNKKGTPAITLEIIIPTKGNIKFMHKNDEIYVPFAW